MNRLDALKPVALLLLRIVVGSFFVYHGLAKLVGDPERYTDYFTRYGFGAQTHLVLGVLELSAGCLLVFGLATRLAALALAAEMVVALWKVHLAEGIAAVNEYEYQATLVATMLLLAACGSGPISVDRLVFKDKG